MSLRLIRQRVSGIASNPSSAYYISPSSGNQQRHFPAWAWTSLFVDGVSLHWTIHELAPIVAFSTKLPDWNEKIPLRLLHGLVNAQCERDEDYFAVISRISSDILEKINQISTLSLIRCCTYLCELGVEAQEVERLTMMVSSVLKRLHTLDADHSGYVAKLFGRLPVELLRRRIVSREDVGVLIALFRKLPHRNRTVTVFRHIHEFVDLPAPATEDYLREIIASLKEKQDKEDVSLVFFALSALERNNPQRFRPLLDAVWEMAEHMEVDALSVKGFSQYICAIRQQNKVSPKAEEYLEASIIPMSRTMTVVDISALCSQITANGLTVPVRSTEAVVQQAAALAEGEVALAALLRMISYVSYISGVSPLSRSASLRLVQTAMNRGDTLTASNISQLICALARSHGCNRCRDPRDRGSATKTDEIDPMLLQTLLYLSFTAEPMTATEFSHILEAMADLDLKFEEIKLFASRITLMRDGTVVCHARIRKNLQRVGCSDLRLCNVLRLQ